MNKFNQLSRAEMKNVLGGIVAKAAGLCEGTATCGDGSSAAGIFDCDDMDGGADGDAACGSRGASTSCDCAAQAS